MNLWMNTLKYVAYPIVPPMTLMARVKAAAVAMSSCKGVRVSFRAVFLDMTFAYIGAYDCCDDGCRDDDATDSKARDYQ